MASDIWKWRVLILTVLNKFRKNPAAEFVAIVVLCGVVEYFTSYYLEVTQGKKGGGIIADIS